MPRKTFYICCIISVFVQLSRVMTAFLFYKYKFFSLKINHLQIKCNKYLCMTNI